MRLQNQPQAERKIQPPNLHKTWEGFFSEALYNFFFKLWPTMPFHVLTTLYILSNPSPVIRHRERARARSQRRPFKLRLPPLHSTPHSLPHFSFLKPHPLLLNRKRSAAAPSVISMYDANDLNRYVSRCLIHSPRFWLVAYSWDKFMQPRVDYNHKYHNFVSAVRI